MAAIKLLFDPINAMLCVALLCVFALIHLLHAGAMIYWLSAGLLVCCTIIIRLRKGTAAARLQEQLTFVAKQIDEARDAIYTVDSTGHITGWNRGAQKLYGYTREQALHMNSNQLLKTVITETELADAWELVSSKDYWCGELHRTARDGSQLYVRSSSTAIKDSSGRVTGYVAVSTDITEERKLAAQVQHLAQLVEQSAGAIISQGLDGRILSWNKGAEKLFGYSSTEAIGKTAIELGILCLPAAEYAAFEMAVIEQGTLALEQACYAKNGTLFTAELTATVVRGNSGAMTSVVFIIKDITLRRAWENNLHLSKEQLEATVMARTAELHRSERWFRALVERNNDVIAVLNADKKVIYRSPSAFRITGFTNEEVARMNNIENMHPDDRPQIMAAMDESSANPGKPVHLEYRSRHKLGHWLIMEGTLVSLLDDPTVGGIIFNFRDVTAQSLQRLQLMASEQRHRDALDNMLEGVQIIGNDWTYLYINEAAAAHGRYTRAQLLGHKMTELYPGITATSLYNECKRCFTERKPIQFENEFEYADGTTAWFELCLQPVPEGIFILSIDITERKRAALKVAESEQHLKTIFDNTSEGFVLLNRDGIIMAFNEMAASTITGFSDHSLETGKTISHFVEQERKVFFKEVFARVLNGETIDYERPYQNANGNTWIHYSFTPVRSNQDIQGLCITARNITDRKRAQQATEDNLASKKLMAERMGAIINTLPANIALLDKHGIIIEVNQAWKNFTAQNGYTGSSYCTGDDYPSMAGPLAESIRCVINLTCPEFVHEYCCDTGGKKRWFRMIVTPLEGYAPAGAVVMHLDISALRLLEQERMDARMEEQKKMKQALLRGQERERNAIGVELHDNVNQVLAGTRLLLSILKSAPCKMEEILPVCLEQINLAIEENRKIAHAFWSPDMNGDTLTAQLERLLSTMLEPAGIAAGLMTTGFDEEVLDEEQKINLYRIAQEQCSNIVKYSRAQSATISLQNADGSISMHIGDDGVGMENTQKIKGIGLNNIRGRLSVFNGSCQIHTAPGGGFAMHIIMPVTTCARTSFS